MSSTHLANVDCYRYSWSSCFAALIIATAEFAGYWHLAQEWQSFVLFSLCPLLLLPINCSGVKVRLLLQNDDGCIRGSLFSIMECFGDAIKMIFVMGSIMLLYVLAGKVCFLPIVSR